jgi:DNA-binding transcriptional LysR family regulator
MPRRRSPLRIAANEFDMIPITFRQLEVFVCVVEAGSFRGCAEQLSISQAVVSEHIRALERQLNCTLFQRQRGGAAALTHMGSRVFAQANIILGSAVDLLATFDRAPQDRLRRRVRIGAHGFIAESLAERLAIFVREHPDVDIELERRSFSDMVAGLGQSELEVGYFLARGPVAELESFMAWEEPMALLASPSHPLAGRTHLEGSDLSGMPYVYLPARTHLRGEIDTVLADLGIRNCPVSLTTDDHRLIVQNLRGGQSFACLFSNWDDPVAGPEKLVRLAFSKPIPPMQIRFAVRSAYRADRTVTRLLEVLNAPSDRVHAIA